MLPRSTPIEQGIDPAGIDRFLDTLAEGGIEMHSLMLLRHGQVVAEGWWAPYAPDRVHLLYSLSKSFTSTAIGFAVAEGRLSVDDTVVSFFPDQVPADASPHLLDMRVHHLLCMGTGHQEDTTRQVMMGTRSPVEEFFAIPPDQAPGTVFAYNSTATYMLSAIITAVTGERLTDYLRPRLFDPLGIDQAFWHSRDGIDLGFSGLHVVTESIASLGQLYLQRGRWDDQQIVSPEWVAEATKWQIDTVTPWRQHEATDWTQGYGYQFWRCQHNAFRADGAHGQFAVVLPDSDVVLAITAATPNMQAILDAAWSTLLPAIDATGDAAAQDALQQRLAGLQLAPVDAGGAGPDGGPWTFVSAVPADERPQFPAFDKVTVSAEAGGWSVRLGDSAEIACGDGSWTESTVDFTEAEGSLDVAVAASAAWTDPSSFTAEIIILDTPHRLLITADLDAGTYGLDWNVPSLQGGDLSRLVAPR